MSDVKKGLIVGITGGIASGKTTVARQLERLGASLVDADQIGREVVDSIPEVRDALSKSFGDSVFGADGGVNRRLLADRVFSDPAALGELNRIVHPHLLRELRSRVEGLLARAGKKVVVIDAALLVEWRADSWIDYLVVVEVDREKQIERIQARDGFSRDQAAQRIVAQVDPRMRARVADEILKNGGSLSDLVSAAEQLWKRLEAMAGGP